LFLLEQAAIQLKLEERMEPCKLDWLL